MLCASPHLERDQHPILPVTLRFSALFGSMRSAPGPVKLPIANVCHFRHLMRDDAGRHPAPRKQREFLKYQADRRF
jgi:hypothetical protein